MQQRAEGDFPHPCPIEHPRKPDPQMPRPSWSKTSTGNAEYQPHTAEPPKILCLGFNMYELFKEFYYLQLIVCVCTYSVILYHCFMLTA